MLGLESYDKFFLLTFYTTLWSREYIGQYEWLRGLLREWQPAAFSLSPLPSLDMCR